MFNIKKPLLLFTAIFSIFIFSSPNAFAYFTTLTTAEVIKPSQIKAIAAPQLIFTNNDGININGIFDMGMDNNSEIRALFGVGVVDFHFGGFYKWAPIPDTEKQPAMAVLFGSTYANISGSNEFSLRVKPIISKNISLKGEKLTPYVSLPLGFTIKSGDNITPIQLTLGTEWRPTNVLTSLKEKNISLFSEIGFNLNDSFSYFTIGVAFQINDFLFEKIPVKTVR